MFRKAIFLGLAVLLVCLEPCSAQISVEVGAKGGLNFSDIKIEAPGSGGQRRTAPGGGLFLTVDPDRSVAFQAELLYMGKGDRWSFFEVESTLKLSYIELPLLFKLQADLLGNSVASLYGGPAPALKTSEEVIDPTLDRDVRDTAKKFDLGAAFGVEFGFGIGEERFLLDLRLTPGFSNIKQGEYEVLGPNSSNQVLSIMAGVAF